MTVQITQVIEKGRICAFSGGAGGLICGVTWGGKITRGYRAARPAPRYGKGQLSYGMSTARTKPNREPPQISGGLPVPTTMLCLPIDSSHSRLTVHFTAYRAD